MSQFSRPIQLKLFLFVTVFLLLFPSGCTSDISNLATYPYIYLLPGETTIRTNEFCFYIGSDAKPIDQTIVTISEELYPALLADPDWSLPKGIEVNTSEITLEPCLVGWNDGDKEYTAPGANLLITYEVSADPTATAVEGDISISFHNLNTLKGENVFYIESLTSPKANHGDNWQLNQVTIFATAAEKEAAITKANVMGAVVVAAIIVVIIFGVWAVMKLFEDNK